MSSRSCSGGKLRVAGLSNPLAAGATCSEGGLLEQAKANAATQQSSAYEGATRERVVALNALGCQNGSKRIGSYKLVGLEPSVSSWCRLRKRSMSARVVSNKPIRM